MNNLKTITRKSEITPLLKECLVSYQVGLDQLTSTFAKLILSRKVKFPLLEYCGHQLFENIPLDEQLVFCDDIEALHTEGGNVILGIILQRRLVNYLDQSLDKAASYIANADIWYVCDIIGERVYGYSLLKQPAATLPILKKLAKHSNHWVIRSLGAGAHYAIKKGLGKRDVVKIFRLLLTMADSKNKEIRQGVGWAAKTTARFHPDIIQLYQLEINDKENVANWFRSKIAIGLNRIKSA